MSSNWKSWLIGSGRERELADTRALLAEARESLAQSPFHDEETRNRFLLDFLFEVCERRHITPTQLLGSALYDTMMGLLAGEGLFITLPSDEEVEQLSLEEGVRLRARLVRLIRFLNYHEHLLPIWGEKLIWVFAGILEYFPLSAFTDLADDGTPLDDAVLFPETPAYALCDNLPEVIERTLTTFFDDDVVEARVFEEVRERFETNVRLASGLPPDRSHVPPGKLLLPSKNRDLTHSGLVDQYLRGTPFHTFLTSPLPFAVPFPARFEHTHIVGGTGHGKTQLLQFLIHHDLVRAVEDGRSVIVLDGQGDLIRTISRLRLFAAGEPLAGRIVIIDPTDIEHPPCLNLFDFNRERLSGSSAVDREMVLNATVELYDYIFGALLGAELTQRQGLIFRYLARLLMEIPGATVHTLRQLMEDGEPFRPYMEKLPPVARAFFETRFFDRTFNETKKQILTRLWGVLANETLERMLGHSRNTIDLFALMNRGGIILINSAKDLLGEEGSAIFGRFFIAQLAQAAVQRAVLPAHERTPAFVYIDEAQDYFDETIPRLITQARKYKLGLAFSHQNLDQLSPGTRASVLASTTIKFAGGVSAHDARMLAPEFRCDAEFLLGQKKESGHTNFACHVRNHTAHALSVRIPLGRVEGLPTLRDDEYRVLRERNWLRVSAPAVHAPDFPPKARPGEGRPERGTPEPVKRIPPVASQRQAMPHREERTPIPAPKSPGRGGRKHKYLQHLVKQIAEDRGFRASIEESILEGGGRVDVALVRGDERIACEISVTTGEGHEFGNVEKCLAAGFGTVVLIAEDARHLKTLAHFIGENVAEADREKVRYLVPGELVEFLDSVVSQPTTTEKIVRGYKVKVVQEGGSVADADMRRKAIAEIIARSLRKPSL